MTKKLPFTYEEFKAIYSKVPRLSVDLIIKSEQGIGLIKRKDYSYEGKWHLPGGTVYYNESLLKALTRIAKDEAGIKIDVLKILGYIEYKSEQKERGFGWTIALVFLCKFKKKIVKSQTELNFFQKLPHNIIVDQRKFLKIMQREI